MPLILDLVLIFNFTLWIATSLWCLRIGTLNTILSLVFLSAIYYGFWNHDLWSSPEDMLSFHLLMLMAMVLTPGNKFWRIFFIGSILMLFADSLWMVMPDIEPWLRTILPEMRLYFPYSIFWWQTLLDFIFWFLCFHALWLCRLTHKEYRLDKDLKNGNLWAFIGNLITNAKIHRHNKI